MSVCVFFASTKTIVEVVYKYIIYVEHEQFVLLALVSQRHTETYTNPFSPELIIVKAAFRCYTHTHTFNYGMLWDCWEMNGVRYINIYIFRSKTRKHYTNTPPIHPTQTHKQLPLYVTFYRKYTYTYWGVQPHLLPTHQPNTQNLKELPNHKCLWIYIYMFQLFLNAVLSCYSQSFHSLKPCIFCGNLFFTISTFILYTILIPVGLIIFHPIKLCGPWIPRFN